MTRDNPVSRRTALKLTGAAASTALVAGCSGGDEGNGNGNGDSEDSGPVEISPDETIMLKATSSNTWEGKSPSGIEGQENPTLALKEGETYEIGWDENGGSVGHNIAIYNGDGEVHNGKKTEQTPDPGDGEMLEFEASSDTVEYVCVPHYQSGMAGDIEMQ
ncbi:plastocyanin/azurin family copper-binding protein [Natrinema salaciae]|uniref:Copper binding protein, plastocyanin/azurin family n=1 Tax=Natrinema salaciae TaxID=1186196 RepID=A0A1H9IHX1_9EURY|nr:plastocyanin/azurin family copper-binding protein [Natrinema salaciae]SEQ74158.1 Copper binding protein, plastocyanin/azurin family [Natrinema salaciae]